MAANQTDSSSLEFNISGIDENQWSMWSFFNRREWPMVFVAKQLIAKHAFFWQAISSLFNIFSKLSSWKFKKNHFQLRGKSIFPTSLCSAVTLTQFSSKQMKNVYAKLFIIINLLTIKFEFTWLRRRTRPVCKSHRRPVANAAFIPAPTEYDLKIEQYFIWQEFGAA